MGGATVAGADEPTLCGGARRRDSRGVARSDDAGDLREIDRIHAGEVPPRGFAVDGVGGGVGRCIVQRLFAVVLAFSWDGLVVVGSGVYLRGGRVAEPAGLAPGVA